MTLEMTKKKRNRDGTLLRLWSRMPASPHITATPLEHHQPALLSMHAVDAGERQAKEVIAGGCLEKWWLALFFIGIVVRLKFIKSLGSLPIRSMPPSFYYFMLIFYVPHVLVTTSDWLQGPYQYALYESYNIQKEDIGTLSIVGFLSSLVFGTFLGYIGDKYGRKLLCILFCCLFSLSCILKHRRDFMALLASRVLSGISTSILFSAFESWFVGQCFIDNEKKIYISTLVGGMHLLGSISAIISGTAAQYCVNRYGLLAPFDLAAIACLVALIIIVYTWDENKGFHGSSSSAPACSNTTAVGVTSNNSVSSMIKSESMLSLSNDSLPSAVKTILSDIDTVLLCLSTGCFESAMYGFVFLWSPTISTVVHPSSLSYGLIFSLFMLCIFIGNGIYSNVCLSGASSLLRNATVTAAILAFTYLIAAIALGLHCLSNPSYVLSNLILVTRIFPFASCPNWVVILVSFLVFEVCCGIHYPAKSVLQSCVLLEKYRSLTLTMTRLPMNFAAIIIIRFASTSNPIVLYACLSIILIFGALLMLILSWRLYVRKNK